MTCLWFTLSLLVCGSLRMMTLVEVCSEICGVASVELYLPTLESYNKAVITELQCKLCLNCQKVLFCISEIGGCLPDVSYYQIAPIVPVPAAGSWPGSRGTWLCAGGYLSRRCAEISSLPQCLGSSGSKNGNSNLFPLSASFEICVIVL